MKYHFRAINSINFICLMCAGTIAIPNHSQAVSKSSSISFWVSTLLLTGPALQTVKEVPSFSRVNETNDPYWAQNRVNGPELRSKMNFFLKTHSVDDLSVPIVVLDKGFNSQITSKFQSNGTIHIQTVEFRDEEFHFSNGIDHNSENHEFDHGTEVSSLIAGNNTGMIVGGTSLHLINYPHLDVLDMLPYSFALLVEVCRKNKDPNGIVIINRSMDHGLELPNSLEESLGGAVVKILRSEGCLLVQAAGNRLNNGYHLNGDGALNCVVGLYRGRDTRFCQRSERDYLYDPVLRVGSSNRENQAAKENGPYEILAPGVDVCTISVSRKCRLSSGTSFSASIVSGIAANVVLVLKSGDYFKTLSPEHRVALVTQIIIQSGEVTGVIDGVKAVEIAELWNTLSMREGGPITLLWLKSM